MSINGIGTNWMTQPNPVPELEIGHPDRAERRIEQMNLYELRGYLCPKSHGDPQICRKCPGKCKAGERAAALLSAQEQKASSIITEEREIFRAACESGNAMGWLIHEKGYNKGQAREVLIYMMDRYPQITTQFGGRKQLLRFKPFKAQDVEKPGPVAAEEATEEETPVEEPKAMETAKKPEETEATAEQEKPKNDVRAAAEAHTRIGRANCEEALKTGDAMKFLMETKGLTYKRANTRFYSWKTKYPDLFEKYGLDAKPVGKAAQGQRMKAQAIEFYREAFKQPDPIAYYMEKRGTSHKVAYINIKKAKMLYGDEVLPKQEEETQMAKDEDLVSITDFIAECDPAAAEAPDEPPVEAPADQPENPMVAEMMRKMTELEEKRKAQEKIAKEAEEKVKWIEDQQDALEKVIGLFRE